MPDHHRTYYSTNETAKMIGVSRQTISRWFREKKVKDVKRNRNERRLFSDDDINQLRIQANRNRIRRKSKKPCFLAVDFFCGAGGTTCGLIKAGGYVIAGIDNDAHCKQSYVNNNTNAYIDSRPPHFLERDIFPANKSYPDGQQADLLTELKNLIPFYRSSAPDVPMLFAICAPCQPFTTLSHKKLSDERRESRERDSNLLSEAAKFIKEFQPEMVLSENVAGIKEPRFGGIWDSFRKTLRELGYTTGSKVVCTSSFGIPQYRKRSILIAVKRGLVHDERLSETMGTELLMPSADPDTLPVSVREAISHLPPIKAGETHKKVPNHKARILSELNLKRLSCAKPGESNAYMENTKFGDLSLECHRKVNKRLKIRCFSNVYTRMHPDRPSPTITTKCHSISNGRYGHYDEQQIRGISLREAAILQSFPENYVFHPPERIGSIARMIGNAVPPKLAAFFAEYLVNSLNEASIKP